MNIFGLIIQLYMTIMGVLFKTAKRMYKRTFNELKRMKEENRILSQ